MLGFLGFMILSRGRSLFYMQKNEDNAGHFPLECQAFRDVESIWSNLKQKIVFSNDIDAVQILDLTSNLDQQQKVP